MKTREQIGAVIEFCRANFPNDGAEGASVHALCDYIEAHHEAEKALVDANAKLWAAFEAKTSGERHL